MSWWTDTGLTTSGVVEEGKDGKTIENRCKDAETAKIFAEEYEDCMRGFLERYESKSKFVVERATVLLLLTENAVDELLSLLSTLNGPTTETKLFIAYHLLKDFEFDAKTRVSVRLALVNSLAKVARS